SVASLRLDGDTDVVPEPGGHAELARDRGRERKRLVETGDVRHLEHRAGDGVDAPGRADADRLELGRRNAGGRGGVAHRLAEVADDLLGTAANRGISARVGNDPRAAIDDDGLDLRAAEVETSSHERRRTTSESGRRFARALHSSAVRAPGSRGVA